jgi:hypothetical protein
LVAPIAPGDNPKATAYGGGRAVQEFVIPGDRVRVAVSEALDDLKMTSIKGKRNGAVIEVNARTEDNRAVLVTVRPHDGQTRVSCRIGLFGDELLSKAVLERTAIRLGTLPPAAIPDKPPSSSPLSMLPRVAPPDDQTLRDVAEAPYRDRVIP